MLSSPGKSASPIQAAEEAAGCDNGDWESVQKGRVQVVKKTKSVGAVDFSNRGHSGTSYGRTMEGVSRNRTSTKRARTVHRVNPEYNECRPC